MLTHFRLRLSACGLRDSKEPVLLVALLPLCLYALPYKLYHLHQPYQPYQLYQPYQPYQPYQLYHLSQPYQPHQPYKPINSSTFPPPIVPIYIFSNLGYHPPYYISPSPMNGLHTIISSLIKFYVYELYVNA
jgi:hypothetical protein